MPTVHVSENEDNFGFPFMIGLLICVFGLLSVFAMNWLDKYVEKKDNRTLEKFKKERFEEEKQANAQRLENLKRLSRM